MVSNRTVVLVATLAAVAGAIASLLFEPTVAYRLAGTEVGQRALDTVLRAQAAPPPAGITIAQRGQRIPTMQLHDTSGQPITVPNTWEGHVTLVNLWATWCAPCLKEMPDLQAFAQAQGNAGVRVTGIALDDAAAVRDFIQQHAIRYPILADTAGPADAGVRLGNPAGVLPFTALIDAEGRLLKTRIGPFSNVQDVTAWATSH